jgi:DNA-binding response OmpR family regulator
MDQKSKVLLIEDNEDCRGILATMIRLLGYEVILPLENSMDVDVDVIVVYLDFPQMQTLRTIYALREDQRTTNIPIIVYLPWKFTDATSASLKAGANEVYDGPLTFKALAAGIAKYVTTHDQCDSSVEDSKLRSA